MATEQIDKLLLLWQDCRQQGRAAPVEELCRGCPELLPELEKRIAALEQLDGCASATTVKVSATAPKYTGAGEWPHVAGYILEAELGRGGMGVVYRAHQLGAERTVALKMISGPAWPGSAEVERFRREARLLASLQHPNIVQVFEVGEHDGLPFFSMEFVAGGALSRRLERQPLPPSDAAPLVATVARAVHAAHEKGILHRDLKPSNLLLGCDPTSGDRPSPLSPEGRGGQEGVYTPRSPGSCPRSPTSALPRTSSRTRARHPAG